MSKLSPLDDVRPLAPPTATGDLPAGTTVAVVGEHGLLVDHARSAGAVVHVLPWHDGGTALAPSAIAAEVAALDAVLVCIGADVPLDLAFDVAGAVDRDHPAISVALVASPDADTWREALRAGVRDVIEPARLDLDLPAAIRRAGERTERVRELAGAGDATTSTRGRVIVVISPKGGSGKTMISSNLAVSIAGHGDAPVALVDLDVQFGDSASALGRGGERSIEQLVAAGPIDPTALKVHLTPHEPSGAFVLCGPVSPEGGDEVTPDHAARIIDLLATDFGYVVVDTPAGIDERTLVALERATDIVFVTSTDVSSIRSLGKELALLRRLGLLAAEHHFVLNRADAKVGVDVADVEAALGMTAHTAVPSSRAVPLSMNQGKPVVLDAPSSSAARALTGLAGRITGHDGQGRRGLLNWRR